MIADTDRSSPISRSRFRLSRPLVYLPGTLAAVLLVGLLSWAFGFQSAYSIPEGVSQQDCDKAIKNFAGVYRRQPTEIELLSALADTELLKKQPATALRCLDRIPTSDAAHGLKARLQEARLLFQLNKAHAAEVKLREVLNVPGESGRKHRDAIHSARQLLVSILAFELRFEERKNVLEQIRRDSGFDVAEAKQFYFPSLLFLKSPQTIRRLEDFLKEDPNNVILLTAQARHWIAEGRTEAAEKCLARLRQAAPNDKPVLAAALECCFEQSKWDDFERMMGSAPAFTSDEPWLLSQVRAEQAVRDENWLQAGKYFGHVLAMDPSNPSCLMGLAKVWSNLGKPQERVACQEHAMTLAKLKVILPAANAETPGAVRAVAQASMEIGMTDAASEFNRLAATLMTRGR